MYLSPLRYPGGKARYIALVASYADRCRHNRYIEPFAGGAAIALHFAIERDTPVIVNDKDPVVYAFWCCVLDDTEALIRRIITTPVDVAHWQQCRSVLNNYRCQSRLDLGFAAFYLNRCNFSGCLKANPIGGLHQSGKWRMDARFNKANLIGRIKTIARHKSNIMVTNFDAVDLVRSLSGQHDFIYLDPPYYKKGKHLYNNYLNNDGHSVLAGVLAETRAIWLMSYDKSPYIERLYSGRIIREHAVPYSFMCKAKQPELLIGNISF